MEDLHGKFVHLNEDKQLEILNSMPSAIRHHNDPSEKLQMAAVKTDCNAYIWIKNPTYAVQVYSIKQNPKFITLLYSPTDELKQIAINGDPTIAAELDTLSEELQLKMVKKDGLYIQLLRRFAPLSPKVQKHAVLQNPKAIECIVNPTTEAMLIANLQM